MYFLLMHRNSNESGMFSTEGIIQSDTTNNTFVRCSTTHLTSFAVLVDTSRVRIAEIYVTFMPLSSSHIHFAFTTCQGNFIYHDIRM